MPEAMRHTDQGYLSTFPEERLRKAASSFFSVTYFRLEIKYNRKFVAMTHEEQISLFEALALNGAWSNAACTGYCLLAMQRAGLDEKTIEKVLHELHWAFDDTSVEQAEKIYCGGEE